MPNVSANNIQIEYEAFGDPNSPPLLLINGFGSQLIFWDEELCGQLAQSGLYVIRFDNRDVGLSSKLEEAGLPKLGALLRGESIDIPYTIEDMADDAVGLLDALGIEKAHICGVSMGGMIAQAVAINHPQHVLSLISIYSTTGNPELPPPTPEAMEAYDRAFYLEGAARQFAAIFTQKNRKPALALVSVPTLVIHGIDDPLVSVEGGKDTAEAIPGSELILIDGMGHDLPHVGGAWPQIIDAIVDHAQKVGA